MFLTMDPHVIWNIIITNLFYDTMIWWLKHINTINPKVEFFCNIISPLIVNASMHDTLVRLSLPDFSKHGPRISKLESLPIFSQHNNGHTTMTNCGVIFLLQLKDTYKHATTIVILIVLITSWCINLIMCWFVFINPMFFVVFWNYQKLKLWFQIFILQHGMTLLQQM